ncbi:MAG: class I SAM-dependent methyltransferase [Acidimicrobiales bacterium]
MLARRELPLDYWRFNHTWGAPNGKRTILARPVTRLPSSLKQALERDDHYRRSLGPFAFQPNTSTRSYEYPWAYHQLADLAPSRVLEIGGALSGLQFVLARDGHDVHNVDPFFDYGAGVYDVDPIVEHAALNRAFRTDVVLHQATLPEAKLQGPFSAVLCISTIEHLSPVEVEATLLATKDLLAPGGLLVLTVDLFLNLEPFCSRTSNVWGTNASLAWMDEMLGYEMITGNREELYGYPQFSTEKILAHLETFAMGVNYPQLAQLVTFRAPGGS